MSEKKSNNLEQSMERHLFRASASDFKRIPGFPLAYDASDAVRVAFSRGILENDFICDGYLKTGNNSLFVRFHWEVNNSSRSIDGPWRDHPKGGDYRKWAGNKECVVRWTGKSIAHYREDKIARILDKKYWDLEGISWSAISSGQPSFRILNKQDIANNAALCIFPRSQSDLNKHLGYLNSKLCRFFLKFRTQTLNFLSGDVTSIPKNIEDSPQIPSNTKRCVELSQSDWDFYETSWDFASLPLLHSDHRQPTLKASYQKLRAHWREMTLEMQRLEEESNRIFIDAYGLQDELDEKVDLSEITLTCNPHYRYGGDKSEDELEAMLLADTMRELVSYAVGCMFGRYSLDKSGLILANQGDTLADYLARVPQPSFPADDDNVIPLLDGDWFPDDITLRFRQFLRIAFGNAHYEDNLAFIEQGLNVKGKRNYGLRDYFLGEFYTDHVKRYKKRPIYWLFSSPKGTFSALVYLHRYRPDTVSVVLNYLRDFSKKLASRLDYLQQVAINPSASQGDKTKANKEAETIKKQLLELDDYERDTLYPLATKQKSLDLDAGVKANYLELGAALKKIPGLEAKGED
ncbi:BREX-1 system adenine-specific DNA-methyltransferase PglX [Pseudomonas tolaasii]|uniref:BREX-1 system adenine-specific DNA-methyltransferase PglX n=1 Tax=Pseudomonas tolaasii TaxID=29442 RepID=UPI0015B9EC6C|nr:BREX-1 system adenine-specific DNA-methyltransferase PglX [Pseudomonas tolaasii]NWC50154.1 BREX-1 system adenine-specific DNA-methyltransferase PglX [Pseudomonas tolaasii]